ncbi:MAG: diaminopimelate dehydrogenase [Clostridiales bacterium]|nr:diaminopimelate dehydrogenase [Clostridiales bacterium]
MSIKIGILGYGNLGKGVETSIKYNEDMELVAIFTRRNPNELKTVTNTKIVSIDEIQDWKDKIDVMILCGGSATDLPIQTPKYASMFNVIDSFDTHAKIYEHYNKVDKVAKENGKVALISCGWDPGAFSLNRLMAESFLPNGNTYTFWGIGVSQGHSDALRRIDGVKNAVQYTIPIDKAIDRVRSGENPQLSIKEKHLRECFVVLEENANAKKIENEIKNMPNYFADYDTIVHFITEAELKQNHSKMPHGGFVIRSGKTGVDEETNQIIEYSLKLESNPEFTASVLLAYARAIYKLAEKNETGCKTVLDIPPSFLINKTYEDLLKNML